MKKIFLFLILFNLSANAEIINAKGKHKHLGDITTNQSCKIAEERAKKNAIINSLVASSTVSSEVLTKCSEIDGEYNCERNQFSLFQLNGDIVSYTITNKNDDKELGSEIYFCEIGIEADVRPVKINQDPTFHFNVKLNKESFTKDDNILEIKINTSKKMYMAIFQWLPYVDKHKEAQVTKIFPNEKFNKIGTNNNNNDLIEKNVTLKYKVVFPNNTKMKQVDEYLVFVASESQIPWLYEFTEIESLKRQLNKQDILMEKQYTGYIIFN
tara:strand:- start:4146 stop:4952 length:807 start_codon:yes stop_codon:yes gene_type:complete